MKTAKEMSSSELVVEFQESIEKLGGGNFNQMSRYLVAMTEITRRMEVYAALERGGVKVERGLIP